MRRDSAVAREEGDRIGESGAGDLRRLVRGIAISVARSCAHKAHIGTPLQCARQCAQTRPKNHQSAANANQVSNKKTGLKSSISGPFCNPWPP